MKFSTISRQPLAAAHSPSGALLCTGRPARVCSSLCLFPATIRFWFVAALAASLVCPGAHAQTPQSTSTALVVTFPNAVTGPTSGTPVTLTANVTAANGSAANRGLVTFYDGATAIGSAQIMTSHAANSPGAVGTAVLKTQFGYSTHSLTASYAGVAGAYSSSKSTAQSLNTGNFPVIVTLSSSSTSNPYTLTATASEAGSNAIPSGPINFVDLFYTGTDFLLGTAPLAPGTVQTGIPLADTPATYMEPEGVVAADFNLDGIPDLAISSDRSPGSVSSALAVQLGNGDGTFTAGSSYLVGDDPYAEAIVVADFNADGIPDLAVSTSDGISVILGNGDGTFTAAASTSLTFVPIGMAVGDFNGDGKPDLAVANGNYQSNVVEILPGNGDGTFGTPIATPAAGTALQHVAAADLNNDGILDLVVSGDTTLTVLFGQGNAIFSAATSLAPGATALRQVIIKDLNGDSIPDVAVADGSGATVVLNNGSGTFQSPLQLSAPAQTGLAVGDFNSDGIPDLATVSGTFTSRSGTLSIFYGKGDGTFGTAFSPGAGKNTIAVTTADLNHDGILDLVAVNYNDNDASVFLTQRVGVSTVTLSGVTVPGSGTHNVDAQFAGAGALGVDYSNVLALTASTIPTTLTLSAPASAHYGDQVTLTAILSPYQQASLSSTGEQVSFWSGGSPIGTAVLSAGVATLATTLPVGTDQISATYLTDGFFAGATSNTISTKVGTSGANNSSLKGQYAFVVHGFLPFNDPTPFGFGLAGSFTADGNGHVTAGVEDINAAEDLSTGVAVSGTYAVASDGTGTVTLSNSAGINLTFAIAVSGLQQNGTAAAANVILASNAYGANGVGIMLQQSPSTFNLASLTGTWSFGLSGETACYSNCSYPDHGGGAASATWMLLSSGTSTVSGSANEQISATFFSAQALSGSLGTPDPITGRTTVTTTPTVTADQPVHYAAYMVDTSQLLLVSTDPHNTTILLTGAGKRQ